MYKPSNTWVIHIIISSCILYFSIVLCTSKPLANCRAHPEDDRAAGRHTAISLSSHHKRLLGDTPLGGASPPRAIVCERTG